MENELNKLLFIGMGGTGIEIGSKLKSLLISERGKIESGIDFLFIDTDKSFGNKPTYMGVDISVKNEDKYHIGLSEQEKLKIVNSEFFKKLGGGDKENFIKHDFTQGAGAKRNYGRAAVKYKYDSLRQLIERKIQNVSGQQNIEADRNWNVVLVCSFLGGTGSGIFLDVSFIVGDILKTKNKAFSLYALVSMPSIDGQKKANCIASINEVEFVNNTNSLFDDLKPKEEIYTGNNNMSFPIKVSDYVFLFSNIIVKPQEVNGIEINDSDEIYSLCAKHIYYSNIYKQTADKIWGLRNNIKALNLYSPKGLSQSFSTFGVYSIEIPIENLTKAIISRYLKEYIEKCLISDKDEDYVSIIKDNDLDNIIKKTEFKNDWEELIDKIELSKENKDLIINQIGNLSNNIKENYGLNNENPKYIKSMYTDNAINEFYKKYNIIEGKPLDYYLETSIKRGDCEKVIKTLNAFLETFKKNIESKESELRVLNNKIKDSYEVFSERKEIFDEQFKTSGIKDSKFLLDKLKESHKSLYEKLMNKAILTIKIKILNGFDKKIREEILPSLEKEKKKLEALKNKLADRFESITREISKNSKLKSFESIYNSKSLLDYIPDDEKTIKNYIDFSQKNLSENALKDVLDGFYTDDKFQEFIIQPLKNSLEKSIDINDYIINNKDINTDINSNINHMLKYSELNATEVVRTDADTIRLVFTPETIKDNVNINNFNVELLNNMSKTKIVAIQEIFGIPLNVIQMYDLYKRSGGNFNSFLNNAFTYQNQEEVLKIIENAKSITLKIEQNTKQISDFGGKDIDKNDMQQVNDDLKTQNYQINQYQALHIGKALKFIDDSDIKTIYYDEDGIEIPITDENGLEIPQDKILEKIKLLILQQILSNKNKVKEAIINYVKSKTKDSEYSKIYQELVENLIRRMDNGRNG